MTKMIQYVVSTYKRFCSYFPTSLPVGKTHYETWLKSIIDLTGPIADEQSMAWVISNEIMRIPSKQDRVAKAFFVKSLRKFAANQIAANKVMELKAEQEAKSKQSTAAEDTTAPAVVDGAGK